MRTCEPCYQLPIPGAIHAEAACRNPAPVEQGTERAPCAGRPRWLILSHSPDPPPLPRAPVTPSPAPPPPGVQPGEPQLARRLGLFDATMIVMGGIVGSGIFVTPYVVGSGKVTEPDAVAQIAASMGTTTEGVGTVALVSPQVVGTVPSSAVFADETGATCIFPDVTGAPVAVTPTGGTLGTVDLDESLVGQAVLINPRDVREDLTCGS